MKPSDIYEHYTYGSKINNAELIEAVDFFEKLANDLQKCGPVFHLAFKEVNKTAIALHEFAVARGLIELI